MDVFPIQVGLRVSVLAYVEQVLLRGSIIEYLRVSFGLEFSRVLALPYQSLPIWVPGQYLQSTGPRGCEGATLACKRHRVCLRAVTPPRAAQHHRHLQSLSTHPPTQVGVIYINSGHRTVICDNQIQNNVIKPFKGTCTEYFFIYRPARRARKLQVWWTKK